MKRFQGEPYYKHGEVPAVGILVSNLGSPDAPTGPALKRYLREFLGDPRVIEVSRLIWKPFLEGVILRKRPPKIARKFAAIWTNEGAPLTVITRKQASGLQATLKDRVGPPLHVEVGMRYGNPGIKEGLANLRSLGCRKILIFPLLPQYASSSVGAAFDGVTQELRTWRWVPELRFITHYHDDPRYIEALAATARELWDREGKPEKLLFSFHGIPRSTFLAGDPYHCECHKTGRLVADALKLRPDEWQLCFQSQLGPEEWLEPYTDKTVARLAKEGLKRLDVMCPGFSADCLETLEEIAVENREIFEENGGKTFRYIPSLNDRDVHLKALADIAWDHLKGWVIPASEWDPEKVEAEIEASLKRAEALRKTGTNTKVQKAEKNVKYTG